MTVNSMTDSKDLRKMFGKNVSIERITNRKKNNSLFKLDKKNIEPINITRICIYYYILLNSFSTITNTSFGSERKVFNYPSSSHESI